jgi:hypothetical protein
MLRVNSLLQLHFLFFLFNALTSVLGLVKEITHIQAPLLFTVNILDYPFDTQLLPIKIGSFLYSIQELQFYPPNEGPAITDAGRTVVEAINVIIPSYII